MVAHTRAHVCVCARAAAAVARYRRACVPGHHPRFARCLQARTVCVCLVCGPQTRPAAVNAEYFSGASHVPGLAIGARSAVGLDAAANLYCQHHTDLHHTKHVRRWPHTTILCPSPPPEARNSPCVRVGVYRHDDTNLIWRLRHRIGSAAGMHLS